jgi:hypothetical protein
MDKTHLTRTFLKHANEDTSDENVKVKLRIIWKNWRTKELGGWRLTDEGLKFLKETLDLKSYEIPFPLELDLKPQVLLYMDKFITCPYHITSQSITVFNEKSAVELHLFSGDVHRYGLVKAMSREY